MGRLAVQGDAVGSTATGVGKLVPQTGEALQAKGQAVYDAGQYRVVVRRPLKTLDKADNTIKVAKLTGVRP